MIKDNTLNNKLDANNEIGVESINKDTFINLGDNLDYDGMGDWGRFPPIEKKNK